MGKDWLKRFFSLVEPGLKELSTSCNEYTRELKLLLAILDWVTTDGMVLTCLAGHRALTTVRWSLRFLHLRIMRFSESQALQITTQNPRLNYFSSWFTKLLIIDCVKASVSFVNYGRRLQILCFSHGIYLTRGKIHMAVIGFLA